MSVRCAARECVAMYEVPAALDVPHPPDLMDWTLHSTCSL
jgi:hypothetical protein